METLLITTATRVNAGRMKNNKNKIMREQIQKILLDSCDWGLFDIDGATDKILSLLGENTEGVSDASTESGVLHDVGESHASGEDCESDLASGELPLEKITDDGNDYGSIELKCQHTWECHLNKYGFCDCPLK